ncbi:MAG: response regulator [Candidatus Methylomirabilis sp.]
MGAKILVADDSVTIQTAIRLTFSREAVELIPARSGEEAIRKARERGPDLMLLDTVLPDRSGYEVCRALKADPGMRDLPVILLAGPFEEDGSSKGQMVGANDVITKPFESQMLIDKVKQLLAARPRPTPTTPDTAAESAAMEVEPLVVHLEDTGSPLREEPAASVAIPEPFAASTRFPRELLERAATDAAEQAATQVAKDVTEKLVERIEKIVREVVPALAETLITKEIERIKAAIEGQTAE